MLAEFGDSGHPTLFMHPLQNCRPGVVPPPQSKIHESWRCNAEAHVSVAAEPLSPLKAPIWALDLLERSFGQQCDQATSYSFANATGSGARRPWTTALRLYPAKVETIVTTGASDDVARG